MTEVSVLSNLRIAGCELKDDYYVSFILLFKTISYHYIGISVIFKSQHGFSIAGAGYPWCGLHNFPSLRRIFCVLNHKYIKWKCFLGNL